MRSTLYKIKFEPVIDLTEDETAEIVCELAEYLDEPAEMFLAIDFSDPKDVEERQESLALLRPEVRKALEDIQEEGLTIAVM